MNILINLTLFALKQYFFMKLCNNKKGWFIMIGKILRKMRLDNNFNQTQLADKLLITQTTLSGWERGYRQPTFESIEKIANYCNYSILFKNNITNEIINTENIKRKDF